MAENHDIDEPFLYLLEKDLEKLEAAASNPNYRSVDVGHTNPDTSYHEIQLNSSFDSFRNVSTSCIPRETRVDDFPATPFSSQGCGSSFDISTPDSLVGARQSIYEVWEHNPLTSFLEPVETAGGDFFRTEANHSNSLEPFSNQQSVGWSPIPQNIIRNTNLGADESTRREEGNEPKELFPHRNSSLSFSAVPPQILKGIDRNEAVEQTREDCRELSSTSAIFSEDASNKERATDSASLGSVAGPSGIQPTEREEQNGNKKLFTCAACGKAFDRRNHFEAHYRTHARVKPFVCGTYGKVFTNKGNLTKHLRTHTGEKPFSCEVCGKRFSLKANLTRHLRTHIGDKPFSCEICGKRFSQKASLDCHLQTHSEEKPHKCKFCRQAFPDQALAMITRRESTVGFENSRQLSWGKKFSNTLSLVFVICFNI